MSGIVQWLTDHLGGLFGNGLSGLLGGLTDNVVVLGLTVFALALGFFAISYLNRRRQLQNQERMAALIKGLHYAGVRPEVFRRPSLNSRDHMMKGVRWLFGSAGLSGTLYTYGRLQPAADPVDALRGALVGLIPGAIALAHFFCSWLCARQPQSNGTTGTTVSRRPVYRTAGRRF
jgi:hypothetical protein